MNRTKKGFRLIGLPAAAALTLSGVVATAAEPAGLEQRQSGIKGLLVRPLPGGNFAGKASQMNATAVPDKKPGLRISFNQAVGGSMKGALNEVVKFLRVRHDDWPEAYLVEIAFEDKWTPKDGPSAAVACALMLDSLITGVAIDPIVAVTGDMNADGSVQPVGGVPAKVRGALAKDCQLVGVPQDNARSLTDLVLLEGVVPMARIQVFAIEHFDQAAALASVDKPAALAKAIEEFTLVQGAVQRRGERILRNAQVQAKLRAIVAGAPNHLSAQLMLAKATGKLPRHLSLIGSIQNIELTAATLIDAALAGGGEKSALAPDDLARALVDLKRVRVKLDQRTWAYADAIQDFGHQVREFQNAPPRGAPNLRKALAEIQSSAEHIEAEVRKLKADKEIMEELLR